MIIVIYHPFKTLIGFFGIGGDDQKFYQLD